MREAKISVMGLYDWDNSLFDLFSIPAALNKNDLVTNLLAELAELEIIYPNPVIMKNLIGVWSRKQMHVWEHLYETTQYEYDPIENYNRYEEGTSNGTGTESQTDRTTHGGQDTNTTTAESGHFVAGFEAGTVTADNDGLFKQYRDNADTESVNQYGRTENHNSNGNNSRRDEYKNHMHGNIGVVSTQDMIKQEREIALFNLYDIIIDEFKQRFCIMVY